jgi:hypothetical protein
MDPADEHLKILKQGVPVWNRFMQDHGYKVEAAFDRADLAGMDLSQAVMNGGHFWGADLRGADLSDGTFQRATFNDALLTEARAQKTRFIDSNFVRATFERADLERAHFGRANLSETNFSKAVMTKVNLGGSFLSSAILHDAKLDGADMSDCMCNGSELQNTDLTYADLRYARFVNSNFRGANLSGSAVYGISVWDCSFETTIQSDLLITPDVDPPIRTDNIAIAQFLYLLLNNREIRHAVDAITLKVVLILGRFTPARKAVLDSIRSRLREKNYIPVLFDFDKPSSRDITETVSTLAHMARFVIADITDARSIPQELYRTIPPFGSRSAFTFDH